MVSHSVSSSACWLPVQALVLLFCLSGAYAAQAHLESQSQVKPTPFPVCIDDSDCLKMGEGNKYACFQVRKTSPFQYLDPIPTSITRLIQPYRRHFLQKYNPILENVLIVQKWTPLERDL